FKTTMSEQVFSRQVLEELSAAAKKSDPVEEMRSLLQVYSLRMGIDSFRNYYILDGKTCRVLARSDDSGASFSTTPNIVTAMAGMTGDNIDRDASYMDYAVPIRGRSSDVDYIISVKDTKEEVYDITRNIFINILWAILFGLLISLILGFVLSRTIIAPLATLQYRAEAMAEGDFKHKIEVQSRDEIGRLTMAFNTMASQIDNSLADIAAEKNKIETVLLHMTDAIIAFDSSTGRVIHENPACENVLGNCVDKTFDEIFSDTLRLDVTMSRVLYLDEGETMEFDVETGGKNYKVCFVPFNAENVFSSGVIVVFRDVTKQLKLENSRREFVANVSHELRTPLTTIKGYAETIIDMEEDEGRGDQPTAGFARIIDKETDRMTRLVKDLLTLSQLDNAKQGLKCTSFNLMELAENVTQKLNITAKAHGHTLNFIPRSEGFDFFGDRDRIEQVITNIVSNAIKYTPDGGKIDVECGTDRQNALIRVTDNGIGIPREDLPHIFERFYRVDKARSRQSGGTGLGLAIAKEITQRHGGDISIDSHMPNGTVVSIVLPLFRENPEAEM
ncbi:MAG: ATP-binding protein, partial [Clostridia bacterium]